MKALEDHFNKIFDRVSLIVTFILIAIVVINLPFLLNVLAIILGYEEILPLELDYDYSFLAIILTCVTISITFSMIVPVFIARNMAKNELRIVASEIFNNEYKTDLDENLSLLRKSDADHSRMNAYFLQVLDKPTWSIGWICRASIRYSLCQAPITAMHRTIIEACEPILKSNFSQLFAKLRPLEHDEVAQAFEILDGENDEIPGNTLKRAVVDLIDYKLLPKTVRSEYTPPQSPEITKLCNSFVALFILLLSVNLSLDLDELFSEITEMSRIRDTNTLLDYLETIHKNTKSYRELVAQIESQVHAA